MVHEWLYLRVPNHGCFFKALMTAHPPDWRSFDVMRKDHVQRPNKLGARAKFLASRNLLASLSVPSGPENQQY